MTKIKRNRYRAWAHHMGDIREARQPINPAVESDTDGWVSRATLQAIVGLPKKAQTSLLRFLVHVGPLDELTGDGLIRAALDYAATELIRGGGGKQLRAVASEIRPDNGEIDIDTVRTLAEAPSEYHPALLKVLLHARPVHAVVADFAVREPFIEGSFRGAEPRRRLGRR